jgi:hypothetical protein
MYRGQSRTKETHESTDLPGGMGDRRIRKDRGSKEECMSRTYVVFCGITGMYGIILWYCYYVLPIYTYSIPFIHGWYGMQLDAIDWKNESSVPCLRVS